MRRNPFDPHDRQRRFEDRDLTRRILDRTSGRACNGAERLLGARWDGELAAADAALLADHLEHCAGCRELALILDRLQPLLPGLAEREPGPAFTARVLARTTGAQPVPDRSPATSVPAHGRRRGLRARLAGVLQRPRIALETAWVAASLAALLIWGPLAPRQVPEQANDLVRAGAGTVPELVTAIGTAGDEVLTWGREVARPLWQRTEQRIDRAAAVVRNWWIIAQELARDDDEAAAGAEQPGEPAPR
jgi:hypothetical protein